ncbi:MAG: DUF2178 domain-containing protein [Luteimonas sp.]|nr:DUF2178 domain-containing protein [Luteimonas sp.]
MPTPASMSFGERYARGAFVGLASLVLVVAVAAFGGSPSRILFFAAVFVLACLPAFRKRRMHDEQRRNEIMEDERDRDIRLRAASLARAVLATGVGALAVALCIPAARQALQAGELVLPGVLVLLVIAAALCGYAREIAGYRAERE